MPFKKGSILLVDKPYGWTSFDVVNKLRFQLRRKYNLKKFKIGHAGTLDPLATGLLVLCTGKKTKEIDQFLAEHKTYTGSFLLGSYTPSFDLETKLNFTTDSKPLSQESLNQIALSFIGKQEQSPPIFSAKKVDGKRAYELARKGQEVELKKNSIEIFDFKVDGSKFPIINFKVSCSKGTYIRSLAEDFGRACNTRASLVCLRRVNSGEFDVKNAKSVKETIELIRNTPIEIEG